MNSPNNFDLCTSSKKLSSSLVKYKNISPYAFSFCEFFFTSLKKNALRFDSSTKKKQKDHVYESIDRFSVKFEKENLKQKHYSVNKKKINMNKVIVNLNINHLK